LDKIKELYLKYKEIINYLIVGVLTTVVSLTVYYGLVLTILNPKNPIQLQAANITSWICAVAFAYWANRKFVFESKSKEIVKEASAFVTARVGTLVMDMVFMFVTVSLFGMNDKVAKLLDQVMVTIANYVFSKLFVFKDKQG
jgi:putative flippase GtrA